VKLYHPSQLSENREDKSSISANISLFCNPKPSSLSSSLQENKLTI
tara:strand:+ start:136 stop:273 length:138 start_codon:yes stop_codon:yes gene_type:complete